MLNKLENICRKNKESRLMASLFPPQWDSQLKLLVAARKDIMQRHLNTASSTCNALFLNDFHMKFQFSDHEQEIQT